MPKKKEKPLSGNGLLWAILKIALSLTLIFFLLLLFAWSWDYWQAYAYVLANLIVLSLTLFFLKDKPELIQERNKPGPGVKKWDLIYFYVTTPLYIMMLSLSALDAGRLGWTGNIRAWVYVIAYLVYFAGQGLFLWAKTVNPFLSSVVRIQKDRGQKVIETGPYRFIRHPSYLGGICFTLTTPLILGSWWALVPAVLSCVALVIRTELEDKTLQRELKGYKTYTQKVRFRLIPGIW